MKNKIYLEISFKFLTIIALSYFAYNIFLGYEITNKKTLLLLLLGELLTIGLVVFSKATNTRDLSLISIVLTLSASFYFFLVNLNGNEKFISETSAEIIMIIGISWQILSKLYLGRNFGLLPAYRGIVVNGPYRVVRHPIYLGYFIMHVGFLLSSFSIFNLFLYFFLYVIQFGRIIYEEKILSKNEAYQNYKEKVRYRIIPFLL
ncbi:MULTISPECIES: isoprenylcysteine carboxylmethyltransferase family protein [unclassified Acinetobacter]|uniref:methyltransferase family protein n=1 Tax=unclassified Acinetobacter TaxID=196816 RepID=UPI001C2278B6|nr:MULTISPECIES: isoprenylcysteine carboxylmethyltransferase family protein [unclassified Acinetobacter]